LSTKKKEQVGRRVKVEHDVLAPASGVGN